MPAHIFVQNAITLLQSDRTSPQATMGTIAVHKEKHHDSLPGCLIRLVPNRLLANFSQSLGSHPSIPRPPLSPPLP